MTQEEMNEKDRTDSGYKELFKILVKGKKEKMDEKMFPNLKSTEVFTQKIKELESYIKELKEGIEEVLKWRNLDGDGISDPLRQELYKLVEKEGNKCG